MSLQSFSPKDPEESVVLGVNFVNLLAQAETIQSASWLVEQEDGTAVSSAAVLSGAIDISAAPVVRQKVIGGIPGLTYLHRAKVVTSAGRTLVGGGLQKIEKGA